MVWNGLDITLLKEQWTQRIWTLSKGERRDDSDVGYVHVQGCEQDMYSVTQLDVRYFTRQKEIPRSMEGTGE